jgi:hypothetical protein
VKLLKHFILFLAVILVSSCSKTKTINGQDFTIEVPNTYVKIQEHPRLLLRSNGDLLYMDKREDANCLLIKIIPMPQDENISIDDILNEFKSKGAEKVTVGGKDFVFTETIDAVTFYTIQNKSLYLFTFFYDSYYADIIQTLELFEGILSTLKFKS